MKLLVISCLAVVLYAKYSSSDRRFPRAIIEGKDAVPHEFPWVVRLKSSKLWRGALIVSHCTGSLISPYIVLTAAHCVKNRSQADSSTFTNKKITVYAGYHKRPPTDSHTEGVTMHSTVFAVPPLPSRHDDYEYYDMAIIILPKPLYQSKTIGFIKLANQNSPMAIHLNSCYAAGFGLTEKGLPKVLQKLHYKVLNRTDCQSVVNSYEPCGPRRKRITTKDMICATGKGNGTVYKGDSGGPFMCRSSKGKWVLYGVSSAIVDVFSGAPVVGMFTKVQPAREWLVNAIKFYRG